MAEYEVTLSMVRHWRSKGIRVLNYLDDFLSGAPSSLTCRLHMAFMLEHCTSLECSYKSAKRRLGCPTPSTSISALGKHISFSEQKFIIADAEIEQVQKLAAQLLPLRSIAVRKLLQLASLIISLSHVPVTLPWTASWMRTRAIYSNIEKCLKLYERNLEYKGTMGWNRYVALRVETKLELQFWITDIARISGQPFHPCAQVLVIDVDSLLPEPAGVLSDTSLAHSVLLFAAQRSLPPGMTLTAIVSSLHDGLRVCGTFTLEEQSEAPTFGNFLSALTFSQRLANS